MQAFGSKPHPVAALPTREGESRPEGALLPPRRRIVGGAPGLPLLHILRWLWIAVGPLAFVAARTAYCLSVVFWIRGLPSRRGSTAMPLALPLLIAEVVFTRVFEVPARGYQLRVLVGLAARLAFAGVLGYFYVCRAIIVKG